LQILLDRAIIKLLEMILVLLRVWKFGENPTRSRHCDKLSFKSGLYS